MTAVDAGGVTEAQLLRALHDEHAGALWAYVVRLTGDRGRADDVVQETLLRAWRNPRVLDQSQGSPRAWLFTVARRIVIDDWRARQSRPEFSTAELPERSVSDTAEQVVTTEVVTTAMRTLSPLHREVLLETFYRGSSVDEASKRLGVAPGTVKSRAHYALRALKAALDEMGVEA
jgi:RNA polymerase sigma-70 factor, ECF subfamily